MVLVSRLTGRARHLLIAATVALAATILLAGDARADSFYPGLSKTHDWADGCVVQVGPVIDNINPWSAIAGVNVRNCKHAHDWIYAEIHQKYSYPALGIPAYDVAGSPVSTTFGNSAGFGKTGSGDYRILETPRRPICGTGYWQEVAVVQANDLPAKSFTSGSPDFAQTGC